MNNTNVRLHFLIYSFIWLLSLHTIIAPSLAGILDVAHDSSSGISEIRDTGAVKSTMELSHERLPHSQPCRRNLFGCVSPLGRGSPIAGTSATARVGESADGLKGTRIFAQPKSWTTSIVLKMRRLEGKILFGFFPKLRDNWSLAHANYEEVLAEVMRSEKWGEDGAVARTLADMRTARQRSTTILGLNLEVRQHISKTRLPKLYQDLGAALDQALVDITEKNRGGLDIDSKLFILNKLFKAELQDPELLPYLKVPKQKLDALNKKYPPKPLTAKPQSLIDTKLPPRPSFSDANKLRQSPPKLDSGTIWGWMDYQFAAEKTHLDFMRSLGTTVLDEWKPIEQLTRELKANTQDSAWFRSEFHPEKFTVSDYDKLEEINLKRRALIKAAYPATKFRYYPAGSNRQEVTILRTIQLQTLAIEGTGEHLEEVVHLLKQLVQSESEKAKPYLNLLEIQSTTTQRMWDSKFETLRQAMPKMPKKQAAV